MEIQVKGISNTLAHLEFMMLEDELKGEMMVTPGIQTGPRIVHIDRGAMINDQYLHMQIFGHPFPLIPKGKR